MDYANWSQMQPNYPNPNPNSDPSTNYYHHSYPPYNQQQPIYPTDPTTALPQSQPAPPGVDPAPYIPPVPSTYAQPSATYDPPAAPAAAPYYSDPSWQQQQHDLNVSWHPDPNLGWHPDPNANWQPDPNGSWRPDLNWRPELNVSWPVSITHYGPSTYPPSGVNTRNASLRPQRSKIQPKKKIIKKTTKVVQPAWCEVCQVACNTQEILDQHNAGKKHKKNVEKLKVPSLPPPAIVATPPANVPTPPVNVAISTASVVTTTPANLAISTAAIIATTPAKVDVSAAAIDPTSISAATSSATPDTLPGTLSTSSATVATSSAIVAPSTPLPGATLVSTDTLNIGPEKKPSKSKASKAKNKAKNLRRRAAAALTEDLEAKRRKVMEGGAPENNVRACSICNVVCNSATVFDAHLAGQKHAAMVQKLMSLPGVAPAM